MKYRKKWTMVLNIAVLGLNEEEDSFLFIFWDYFRDFGVILMIFRHFWTSDPQKYHLFQKICLKIMQKSEKGENGG